MSLLNKLFKYAFDKDYRFLIKANATGYPDMSDEEFLRRKFKVCMKKDLDLDNPKTFNEKLQWLKLHNRCPEYTVMVDKYLVRDYIREQLGEEYLIPLIGVWDDPDEIDFDALPDKFVLKCNHNSGLGMYICRDKSKMDIEKVKKDLRRGLAQDYYLTGREWPYKNVPRKIICEKFMSDGINKDIKDYKFFCFNGIPMFMYISSDNAQNPTTDFFDMDFNHLNLRMKDPNSEVIPSKPPKFDEMKEVAIKLSQNIPFVRVDMYVIDDQIYFGELTFFHNCGFCEIHPEEWGEKLGSWIDLDHVKGAYNEH